MVSNISSFMYGIIGTPVDLAEQLKQVTIPILPNSGNPVERLTSPWLPEETRILSSPLFREMLHKMVEEILVKMEGERRYNDPEADKRPEHERDVSEKEGERLMDLIREIVGGAK